MTRKPDKPDLDLIHRVQQARMLHDSQATPSEIDAVYWIEAKSPGSPPPTARSGQWIITIPTAMIDHIWNVIKRDTERGELGYKAKVATAPRAGQASSSRPIHICVVDSADTADVERVGSALRALGFEPTFEPGGVETEG